MYLLWHHISNDFRSGILGQWRKYLVAVILMIIIGLGYLPSLQYAELHNQVPSMGDFLFHYFKGMEIIYSDTMGFKLDAFWFAYHFLIAFIVSDYPYRDLNGFGQQLLLRSQKRSLWWSSKCVWVVLCVLVFYGINYLIIFLFTICTGSIVDLAPMLSIGGLDAVELTGESLFVSGIILPVVSSVCLSLMQLLLSLVLKPIISMITVAGIIILSVFVCSEWCIGNYLMIARNASFQLDGVETGSGLIIMLSVTVLVWLSGIVVMNRKDILNND